MSQFETEKIGWALIELGGGRKKVTDKIDPRVGFEFHCKLGDRIKVGTPLCTVHLPPGSTGRFEPFLAKFRETMKISTAKPRNRRLILGVLPQ